MCMVLCSQNCAAIFSNPSPTVIYNGLCSSINDLIWAKANYKESVIEIFFDSIISTNKSKFADKKMN